VGLIYIGRQGCRLKITSVRGQNSKLLLRFGWTVNMHPLNRQIVLSQTKADLARGKGCSLRSTKTLVPKWPGAESGALLEEFVESKTETAFADKRKAASKHYECKGTSHSA
jgi:hypothetical protein